MTMFPCPHCKKPTISLGKKYLAGKWFNIYCDQCSGRICAQPILLAAMSFLYVWDVMYFGVVAIAERNWLYIGLLIAFWLLLDTFNHYIPLQRMKSAHKKPSTNPVLDQAPEQYLNQNKEVEINKKLEDS